MVIAERVVAVDKADVEPTFKREILETIVEEQCVAAEALDGVPAGFDAIFIHEDDDIFEIRGKHVRFVAGLFDVEQQRLAVGNNLRGDLVFLKQEFGGDALPERARCAFVTARKNGDAPAGLLQGACKNFDDRRLAGAADGEIANADDLTAERVIAKNPVPPEPEPALHDDLKNSRQAKQHRAGEARAKIVPAIKDDIENVLLDGFSPLPH